MRNRFLRARSVRALVAAVAAGSATPGVAGAVELQWDVAPGTVTATGDNAVTGGAGTWNTTNGNWTANNGASNVAWVNANIDVAVFGDTGGAVSITTPIVANGVTFNANGYTVSSSAAGNTLSFAGATPTLTVAPGVSATLSAVIAGGADNTLYFTKAGDGSLTLGTGNTFLGDVRIVNGALIAPAGGAFGGGGANGTRIILDQDTANNKTAVVQINATYDPGGSGGSFDRYVFGPGGGTINVAGTATTQQQLTLNDANQFGDHTGATGSTVFTKAGDGLLLLGNQTYAFTGQTRVAGGTLRVDGANALGNANNNGIAVESGGTLDVRVTLAGTNRPVSVAGAGWNNGGALVAGGGTGQVGPVTLTNHASIGGASQLTVGSIGETPSASAFNLTKVGAGLTILNASNAYTGNTTVAGGTLRDTTGTSLPAASGALLGNLTLAGGAFETRGTFSLQLGDQANRVQFTGATSAGLSAAGAALAVGLNVGGVANGELVWGSTFFNPGTLILNGASANNSLTLNNPIDLNAATGNVTRTISVGANNVTIGTLIRDTGANTAGLTKTGGGTLFLTNANNSYDGNTTISGGVLSVPSLPDGPTSPIGAGNVVFGGAGTFRYSGNTAISTARTFTVGGQNATIEVSDANGGLEIPSTISGNVANTLTKSGPGSLTLSGSNDNNSLILNAAGGRTDLNKAVGTGVRAVAGIANIATNATVRLTGANTDQIYGGTATGAAALVNLGGGTLDLNTRSESVDRLTGYGTVTNNGASGTTSTFTVGEFGGNASAGFAGNVNDGASGGQVALVKVGAGTQALLGGGNYSGGTRVNAGTLRVQSSTALGTGPVTLNGGTLALAGSAVSGFGGNGAGFTLNNGATVTGDVLTLTTNTGSLARSVYFNNRVDVRGFNASFRYDNGADNGGADGFTFILQNQGLNALGASGGSKGYASTIAPSVAVVFNIFGTDLTSVGSNGSQNNLLANENTVPAALLNLADINVAYNGTRLTFTVTNPNNPSETISRFVDVNLSTVLGGSGAFVGFTGGTGGTTAAQTISNFSFAATTPVSVANAVNVQAGSTSAIDVGSIAAAGVGPLTLGSGSTLNVTGTSTAANTAYALTAGATSLAGGATINVANNGTAAGTLTIGDLTGNSNFLTKTGPGVLAMNGSGSSTSGPISVQGGTLLVNTTLTATSVSVTAGSVLGGNAVLTGTGSVNVSGTVSPGTSVGTITSGGPVTIANGTYRAETAEPGTSDLLALSGAAANGLLDLPGFNDTLDVVPLAAVGTTPATYTIATFASVNGVFDNVLVNGAASQDDDPSLANYVNVLYPTSPGGTPGEIRIEVANVVPEPASLGVLAVGAAGLLARRRRRNAR